MREMGSGLPLLCSNLVDLVLDFGFLATLFIERHLQASSQNTDMVMKFRPSDETVHEQGCWEDQRMRV